VLMTFSDRQTFRHDLMPTYKAHRKAKRKPLVYPRLRHHALEQYEGHAWPNLEADDIMGILGTSMQNTIIVTIDKDLRTIPGRHYNPDKPDEGVVEVSPEEADQWFLVQCMAGDPTDGYAGIPGVGVKTAKKLLDAGGYTWETVKAGYEKKGLTEDVALENARMARILTSDMWNIHTEEVTYWSPEMLGGVTT